MKLNLRQTISSFLSGSGRRVATVLAIVIAALLGYHATFGANGLTAYQQKRHQHQTLQKEIQQLQQQNSRLQDHVQHLVLVTLLLISRQPVGPESCVVAEQNGDDDGYYGCHPASRTRKKR